MRVAPSWSARIGPGEFAHVPPGESHEQQQGEPADGDTGDDRPIVDLAFPVDRSLKLLAQLDCKSIQCFCQGD